MNKGLITNLFAFLILIVGILIENQLVIMTGLFALSGAITNWLAVYMLFEKVPGLVGSGVIPARFEEFKGAIEKLIMEQFFNQENIDRFMANNEPKIHFHLAPVIEKTDLTPAFDRLVSVIMESSFGSMLSMFGGASKLEPLKEPFVKNMKEAMVEIAEDPKFIALLQEEIDQPNLMSEIQDKIETMVHARLEELTPEMVKDIVQQMIREHLGWLVVWGGIFGGLIGLISAYLMTVLNI